MKKFIKTLLLTFSLSPLFVSCHFLEVEQLGKSDIPSFFSDIDSVDPAVRGAYNLLYSLYDHYLIT